MSSPQLRYRSFTRDQWSSLRDHDDKILLDAHRIEALKSIHDSLTNEDVLEIYLPLIRYIELHIEATEARTHAAARFLRQDWQREPFVIGIAGSVAAGKSTVARVLEEILSHPRRGFKVSLVTTDGFIYPAATLEARGLISRKGFPESYDRRLFVDFLSSVKSGEPYAAAPVYSHVKYDRVPGEFIAIENPDILIIEGLNILQPPPADRDPDRRFASDFIDLSVYLHAAEPLLKSWYIERFLALRKSVFSNPDSHFRRYAALDDAQAEATASEIWDSINGRNLIENILPTRYRADVILNKGERHRIETVQVMNR
ncbi:MAG TPA: type I pantothenate kinase [Bryobacteraceae bacterium]|jgi:type I pantothenate kinase